MDTLDFKVKETWQIRFHDPVSGQTFGVTGKVTSIRENDHLPAKTVTIKTRLHEVLEIRMDEILSASKSI